MADVVFKNGGEYLLHIIDCSKNNDENIFIDEEKYKGVTLTVDGYTLPENPKEWKQDKSNLNIYRTQIGDAEFTVTYKDKNLLTLEMKKGKEVKIVEPVGIKLSKYVYYHGEPEILNDENDEKWLSKKEVDKIGGWLTFNEEGIDEENSMYFSRTPHWPKLGTSGITIGRGYDIGVGDGVIKLQNVVRNKLKSVSANNRCKPINNKLIDWLVGGTKLKGNLAKNYLEKINKLKKEDRIITRKQQFYLFTEVLHKEYLLTTIRTITKPDVEKIYGKVMFDKIPYQIRDVLFDLTYRGDNHGETRGKFMPLLVAGYNIDKGTKNLNNYSSLVKLMGNLDYWCKSSNTVPLKRFEARRDYLLGTYK